MVDTIGVAKLRVRYLSKYNLILAPHFTPINSTKLEEGIESILNGILADTRKLDEIIEIVESVPRHEKDR